MKRFISCKTLGSLAALSIALAIPNPAAADVFDEYGMARTMELPGIDGEVRDFDTLDDGRLLVFRENGEVYIESSAGSGTFALQGTIPFAPGFNLTFVKISPDGLRFAVGDFSTIAICEIATLSCTNFTAPHFSGIWLDDQFILTTQSLTGAASRLDTLSADPANPDYEDFITGIPGFPAGLVLDDSDNLIVGTFDPAGDGVLRYYDNASWTTALSTDTPIDYTSGGELLGAILSAITLGFDGEGNLHVGGSAADQVFGGLVRNAAVIDAAAGNGTFDVDDVSEVRQFTATECGIGHYYVQYNSVTGELYVRCYGESTTNVFAPGVSAVPTTSTWGMSILTGLLLVVATVAFRKLDSPSQRAALDIRGACGK